MILLPTSFDYVQLMVDFFALSTPFVVIAVMFAASFIVKRSVKSL